MKLVTVSGLMGSGKTSLIRRLVETLRRRNLTSAIIVNESGETSYDDEFLRATDVTIESLRGG